MVLQNLLYDFFLPFYRTLNDKDFNISPSNPNVQNLIKKNCILTIKEFGQFFKNFPKSRETFISNFRFSFYNFQEWKHLLFP